MIPPTSIHEICVSGASHFPTPLLTPRLMPKQSESAVELMTNTGMIVNLPHNPRENFAQYIVSNQINPMTRYDSFQTFEDQGVHHHPNQKYMSDFDIITCDPGKSFVRLLSYTCVFIYHECCFVLFCKFFWFLFLRLCGNRCPDASPIG